MTSRTQLTFSGLPSMVPAYAKVVFGKKPYIAPEGTRIQPIELCVERVRLSRAHLRRYAEICAAPLDRGIPPAYLHVVAMPLHMQLFVAKDFPVKVLGLIHLRTTSRVLVMAAVASALRLSEYFDSMCVNDFRQVYVFTTRYEQHNRVVWEEVRTMFARGTSAPK